MHGLKVVYRHAEVAQEHVPERLEPPDHLVFHLVKLLFVQLLQLYNRGSDGLARLRVPERRVNLLDSLRVLDRLFVLFFFHPHVHAPIQRLHIFFVQLNCFREGLFGLLQCFVAIGVCFLLL